MSFIIKILVLGDEKVGKRSLINRLSYPRYSMKKIKKIESYWPSGFITVLYKKEIYTSMVKFQIWILNPLVAKIKTKSYIYGKYRTQTLGEVYCRAAHGAIVVFDTTNMKSFNNVQRWIKLVWKHNGKGVIPLTIVATKIDLRGNTIATIPSEKGKQLAEKFSKQSLHSGFKVNYKETSINDNTKDVEDIFQELGESYIEFINLKRGSTIND